MAVTIGTDSYGDEAGLEAYATKRGVTIVGDKSVLLIKAMDWLESLDFLGVKYIYTQALQFPRLPTPYDVDAGTVPPEVINAQYAAALLIDSGEDLNPVIEPAIKRENYGRTAVEIEYQDNASPINSYPQLTRLLKRHLANTGGQFRVTRG